MALLSAPGFWTAFAYQEFDGWSQRVFETSGLAFSSAFSLLIIERPDCMIEERGLKQRGVKKRNFTAFKIIPNIRLSNIKGHANDFTACLAVLANHFRFTLF